MANYGPPGGPYPGPPQQPWHDPDRQGIDEYGQPVDPWGDHDQLDAPAPWGGTQPSAPPDAPGSPVGYPGYPPEAGYPHDVGHPSAPQHPQGSVPAGATSAGRMPAEADPVWAPAPVDPSWSVSGPDPMPKGGGSRVFVAVLAGLAVLVFGGVATGIYLYGRDRPPSDAQPPVTEQTDYPVEPSTSPEPGPTTPATEPSTDARFVEVGDCVRNEGTDKAPKLTITRCAPQTYEVLTRYNGATTGEADAKAKCSRVQNYTNYYFFNSELDELDFVLCLRKR